MASVLDDLRYLSRYGYQDPWAEAVKNVSNNLMSLAETKMRRDMLIAQFKDKSKKDQIDAEDRHYNRQLRLWESIPSQDYGTKKVFIDKYGTDFFGDADISSSVSENVDKGILYQGKVEDNNEVYSNKANPFSTRYAALSENAFMAGQRGLYQVQNRIQTQLNSLVKERQYTFTINNTQALLDSETEKSLTPAEVSNFQTMLNNGNTDGVIKGIQRAVSLKTGRISVGKNYYTDNMKELNELRDDLEEQVEETGQGNLMTEQEYGSSKSKIIQASLQFFPVKYRDLVTKYPMEQIIAMAEADMDALLPKKKNGKNGKNGENGKKIISTLNLNVIAPGAMGEAEQSLDVSNVSKIMIKNTVTNKEQLVSGSVAQQLINNNRAELVMGSKKSYIELSSSIAPGVAGSTTAPGPSVLEELSFLSQDGTNQKIPLKTGDVVIDKSSGKRLSVEVVLSDKPKVRHITQGRGYSYSISEKYKYLVNGKVYSMKEFQKKFAVPLFIEQEVAAVDSVGVTRPTVTGFSVTPVK
jgi:hypothetical protein